MRTPPTPLLWLHCFHAFGLGMVLCCGPFGRQFSFKSKDSLPFNHYRIENDPEQVKADKITPDNQFAFLNMKNLVRFKLWTRKNPRLAHEIKYKDLESLKTSNFHPSRLTKILVHGFADSATEQSTTYYLLHLKDAYLELGDVNVIVMDYSLFTIPLFYWTGFTDIAGARLAEFLHFIVQFGDGLLDSIHLIGFSWGAHVSGLAGHALEGKIGRITGLDPAGPTFRFVENEFRLDSSDAKFVDVIHTNGGGSLFYGAYLGSSIPSGHADYYPNNGSKQIGCPRTTPLVYETLECSHGRSIRLFMESIKSPLAFPACNCETLDRFLKGECPCAKEDITFMGEHVSHKARGKFQLITRSKSPFGHGPSLALSLPDLPRPAEAEGRQEELQEAKIIYKGKGVVRDMNGSHYYSAKFPTHQHIAQLAKEVVRNNETEYNFL